MHERNTFSTNVNIRYILQCSKPSPKTKDLQYINKLSKDEENIYCNRFHDSRTKSIQNIQIATNHINRHIKGNQGKCLREKRRKKRKKETYFFDLIPPSEIGFEFVANDVVEESRVEEDPSPCTDDKNFDTKP